MSQDGNGISIKINGVDKEIKGSHLLLAVGRVPIQICYN
jgi:hypothetical protein